MNVRFSILFSPFVLSFLPRFALLLDTSSAFQKKFRIFVKQFDNFACLSCRQSLGRTACATKNARREDRLTIQFPKVLNSMTREEAERKIGDAGGKVSVFSFEKISLVF